MEILPNSETHAVGNDSLAVQFASMVLPEAGWFSYSTNPLSGVWRDHFASSITDLVRLSFAADQGQANVYFCTASFSGNVARKRESAQAKKCFYLDLDVQKKRGDASYPSHEAAAEAAEGLIAVLGVGRPIWVNSGKGIHLYWPLKAEVPVDVWKPVADRFKAWAIGTGAIIDKNVPADVVRVLRLPGTTWRDKEQKEDDRTVGLIDWGDGPFSLEEIDAAVSGRGAISKAANNDDWGLGPIPQHIQDRMVSRAAAKALQYPPRDWTPELEEELRSALMFVPADKYDDWWHIGAILRSHHENGWRVFLWWSETCAAPGTYDRPGCEEKWAVLSASHGGRDRTGYVAHIFNLARDRGWQGLKRTKQTEFRYDASTHSADWMLDQACPPIEWAFGGVLVRDCVGVITAPGGVGKTFMALQMGVAMAAGISWLGRFPPASVGRVALISAETDALTFQRRLHSVVEHHKQFGEWSDEADRAVRENLWLIGVPPEEPTYLLFMDGKGRVSKEDEVVEKIVEQVGNLKPDLIFLDTRNLFCGGDENSAAAAGAFMRALSEIRTRTGARNLIVIDHANKSSSADESMALSQNASAGSVQFINNAKWQLAMAVAKQVRGKNVPPNQARDYVRCAVPKNNDGPQPEDFLLLRGEGGVLRVIGEEEALGRMAPSAEARLKEFLWAFNLIIARNGGEPVKQTDITRGNDSDMNRLGGEPTRKNLLKDAESNGYISLERGKKNAVLCQLTESGRALAWEKRK